MKKIINYTFIIGSLAALIFCTGCKKKVSGCMNTAADNFNRDATSDDGSCQFSGDITFYYRAAQSSSITTAANPATVTINGQVGYITVNLPYEATCNLSGCANFHLPTGNYNYTAKNLTQTWQGIATVGKECNIVLIQ
ncbi:MAG: hypothetical protein SFY56_09245 [Bacteroidota bacterium]|nr:hypothetical protein [Bacteroidota bacterium]